MRPLRRSAATAAAIALVVLVLGSFLYTTFIRPSLELQSKAKAMQGRSKAEVIEALGTPERALSRVQFEQERDLIAKSYSPDPPLARCDEVLMYTKLATMALLYVDDGVVVLVHTCGT